MVRIYLETKNEEYSESAKEAFKSFLKTIDRGGVAHIDKNDDWWLEEYIVDPPSHILNGFIWALWGVYDFYLLTQDKRAQKLFKDSIKTLKENLNKYDTGFWSLYEQSKTKMRMLASPFYHNLHTVQLNILYKITGEPIFKEYAEKWEKYKHNWFYRNFALIYKSIFKIIYY